MISQHCPQHSVDTLYNYILYFFMHWMRNTLRPFDDRHFWQGVRVTSIIQELLDLFFLCTLFAIVFDMVFEDRIWKVLQGMTIRDVSKLGPMFFGILERFLVLCFLYCILTHIQYNIYFLLWQWGPAWWYEWPTESRNWRWQHVGSRDGRLHCTFIVHRTQYARLRTQDQLVWL